MLIIPVTRKLGLRNPPVVTLLLILANCLIFFAFQLDDNRLFLEAELHYQKSGLAKIEIPLWLDHLSATGNTDVRIPENPFEGQQTLIALHREMENDFIFMQALKNGRIIFPDDPAYGEWKNKRLEYEGKVARVVSWNYGFIPARHEPLTLFTYMFLHGGMGHLIGNMLFLWLVGCMLEMGIGRVFCLAAYVLTGLCAVGLFWAVYPLSAVPLVGASGSIAGFMGAFTVIFGLSRVKIFYSLGFYFNYLRVPAIALLPLWIGNEIYQIFFSGPSNVAYMAHIGGLLGGAGFGVAGRLLQKGIDTTVLDEEVADEVSPLLEAAMEKMAELELEKARTLVLEALEKSPGHPQALSHLFSIDSHLEDPARFHRTAARVLTHFCNNRQERGRVHPLYLAYVKKVKPRLPAELYARLSMVFAMSGQLNDAEKLIFSLVKHKPETPGIPPALLRLAGQYREKNLAARFKTCFKILKTKYPQSPEARILSQQTEKKS